MMGTPRVAGGPDVGGGFLPRDSGTQDYDEVDSISRYDNVANLYSYSLGSSISRTGMLGFQDLPLASREAVAQAPPFHNESLATTDCDYASGKPSITMSIPQADPRYSAVNAHEQKHASDISSCCARYAKCVAKNGLEPCKARYSAWADKSRDWIECRGYEAGISEAQKRERQATSGYSICALQDYIVEMQPLKAKYCAAKGRRFRCPFDWQGNIRTNVIFGELP
jgi:hypothetical protein